MPGLLVGRESKADSWEGNLNHESPGESEKPWARDRTRDQQLRHPRTIEVSKLGEMVGSRQRLQIIPWG